MAKELKYETLFKHLSTAYIVVDTNDPEFTIIEENDAHAAVAMVKRSDVIGKPLLEAFPDVSEKYVTTGESDLLNSLRKVMKTKKSDQMPHLHYDLKNKRGKLVPKYWSVTHHPIIEGNKVVAIYQETCDITDSVLANDELDKTKHQLEQTLMFTGIGTWIWDMQRNIIIGDKNFAFLFGLSPDDMETGVELDKLIDSVVADDKKRVEKSIQQALTNKESYECEYRTIDAEENVHWVMARGRAKFKDGKPTKFTGMVIDITDRKMAENNVRFINKATRQFAASLDYRETLNTIAAMLVPGVTDWCAIDLLEDGRIERVAIAHKDPAKVKWAKEIREQQGEHDLSNEKDGVAYVIRTGELAYVPQITDEMLVAASKNKEELKIARELGFSSVIIAPLKIDKKTIGAISFVTTESHRRFTETDKEMVQAIANRAALAVYNANLYTAAQVEIADRKQLQTDLEEFNYQLEDRVIQRTHELESANKVLTAEVSRRKKAEKELKEYSKNLAISNQELQDFAYVASHDLQEPLRKIQAFGDILESEYADQLTDGVEYLDRMKKAASRMSVLIEDLLAFSRVSTRARPNSLVDLNVVAKEVLSDLEAQLTRTKGKVEVSPLPHIMADSTHMRQLFQNLIGNALKFHKPDEPPIVKVYEKPTETAHVVYVEDNGIGFDEKYVDKIFSVFQRLHGKDEYEGTGIGLAVVHKIAERYNGTITAKSKKGKGSVFAFTFPKQLKEKKQ